MRRMMLLVSVVLAACGETPASIDVATTWSLSAEPIMTIGVADGDERYMFTHIGGARLLRDGGVVVSDWGQALLIYDSTGTFVRRIGRRGSGPGEFERILRSPFIYRGDSIAIWDLGLRRVSVFDASGTFGRMVTVQIARRFWQPGTIPEYSCCSVTFALSDGGFLLEYPPVIPNQPGPNRHSLFTLQVVSPDGAPDDTIGPFESRFYRYDGNAPSKVRDLQLSVPFMFDVAGDTIFGGNGEGPWIVRVVPGSAPDTIRLQLAPVPVTTAVKEAYANAYRAEFARRPRIFESPIEDFFTGEYMPNVPAYSDVRYDGAGGLWLGQWGPPFRRDSTRYHVYSTTGRPVARVALPPTSRIADIRGNRIALIATDSLDVQYVGVYEIIKHR